MPGTVEMAMQAIVKAYEGLTVENGYSVTVKKVHRHFVEPESLSEEDVPIIWVMRMPGPSGTMEGQDETFYKETIRVSVWGFFRPPQHGNPEDIKLATQAEAFLADLKKVQMVDSKFTFADSCIHQSILRDDANDATWEEDGAVVGITMDVIVFFTNLNP